MLKIVKTIIIGISATATIDCFTYIVSFFGQTPRGVLFVGRWLAYFSKRQFVHNTIIESTSVDNELLIGQIAHYGIGIAFAFMLIKIYGEIWLTTPKLGPALTLAIITLVTSILILQPALGFGIAFSNMPNQIALLTKTVFIHLIYGFGLYGSAIALNRIKNGSYKIKKCF